MIWLNLCRTSRIVILLLTGFAWPLAAQAWTETKPSIAEASTIPSITAWFIGDLNYPPSGNPALFDGYPSAMAACTVAAKKYMDMLLHVPHLFPYRMHLAPIYDSYLGGMADYFQQCVVQFASNPNSPGQVNQTMVSQKCPAGYTLNVTNSPTKNPYVNPSHTTTTLQCDSPTRCPDVPAGEPVFVLDVGGKTCSREVAETYTIALSGLGGEVVAGGTRAAYAEVKTSAGEVKSGAQVSLTPTVVPDDDGQVANAHEGKLLPVAGNTDGSGKFNFTFIAPVAGGTHTITASCTNCTNEATGTIKVSGCQIPRLTSPPFSDPVAEGFENGNRWRPDQLTSDYQTKLTCVQNGITAINGTYTATSAYRPTQYQQHLFEIVQKDELLDNDLMNAHPECQFLRNKVSAEMSKHSLQSGQAVATPGTSRHESGTAFDLTPHGLTEAQKTTIFSNCGVTHTAVSGEPWHIQ
jgi:hypothetical protein